MKYFMGILIFILTVPTYAGDTFVASLGYALGGTSIVEEAPHSWLFDTDDELRAGDGVQSEIGVHIDFTRQTALRLLVGYKYNSLQINSTKNVITSFPLSALYFYKFNFISLGGGLTYHINPKFTARGEFDDTAEFDNALGFSSFVNFRFTRSELFSLQIRYTAISYKGAKAAQGNTNLPYIRSRTRYAASNLAVFGVFRF